MYNEYEAPEAKLAPVINYAGLNMAFVLVPFITALLFNITSLMVNDGLFSEFKKGTNVYLIYGIFLFTTILFIVGEVFNFVAIYRAWFLLNKSPFQRVSPGKAVGYLFIPIFNIYWMFQAHWGFTGDFNSHIKFKEYAIEPLNRPLLMAYCILTLCNLIPYVGMLTSFATIIIALIYHLQWRDRLNILAKIRNEEERLALSVYNS